jgi:beta-glucanase (GH16 family)
MLAPMQDTTFARPNTTPLPALRSVLPKSRRALVALAALAGLLNTGHAADWQLVWADEFDRDGLPDPAKWSYEEGFVRNRELQFYTAGRRENARVEGGHLIIEARRERWPNPRYRADAPENRWQERRQFADYTSASLTTRGKAAWTYGRLEARAKLPTGRGTWPAFWTLGTNITQVGWPACGEIDILEYVGHDPGVVHANVHTRGFNHARGNGRGASTRVPDAATAFHVYAVEWSPQRLEFFVDDRKYFTLENDGTGPDSWPFDAPQFLILNLAIGGSWGGQQGVDDAIFPQRFVVDYVRVYQRAGAGQ